MFTTAKSVATAIAPFKKVVDNLTAVIAAQEKASSTAMSEQASARETWETVQVRTENQKAVAEIEKARAERLKAKLEALLEDI